MARFCLLLLALTALACAADDTAPFCYLPIQSNVAYSDVTSLPVGSPAEIISYGPEPLQFGELWLPGDNPITKHPLVVFIHGGCWLNEYDIQHTHAFSTALAHAGYAVWSIEYRRTGDEGGGWPGSYNDIKSAVSFVEKLKDHPIDIDQPVLTGHSAGGHLALLAGGETDVALRGIIGLAAIVDLQRYAQGDNSCQTATPRFMGGTPMEKPEAYNQANPAIRALPRTTRLIHGDADIIVPLTQATDHTADTLVVQGAGHFDVIHPGTPAFQTLLKELANLFK